MNLRATPHRSTRPAAFTLIALESLPCGCVSGVYSANPTANPGPVELELVEAKGPHCVFIEHRPGGVVRLAVPGDIP